ncbi:general secretion pathway protein GspM [Methylomonas sp. EFPC1]|uniref:Type II secretion system protein GspM n=1 Tax=Methylomonas defluvii TaxID=3045149 RepID=A0ABU4UJ22_9GAMM|nr:MULTISPECIES: type II secretion system protein GspM [unclassified Methylomonas]MDX8129484.1 type II secretion system protein GspM [Methylomonas sp. OY6]NOV28849.1 general secretion pathway protein GspM [Methylomonas sp. ZR1]PKD41136.1 general secretion pathway protein GspM [Methylomonas sp. Kb3]QSB02926.1 general secretion pathway protein GspM [Methylomonas sp. EFPC1]
MNQARYQRWLALALLGLVLFTVIFLVLLPLFSSWLDYREQKNDLLFRLQRQQAIVARRDSVAQNLESLNQQYQQQGYLSDSDTEALASAELQNIVKTAVTEAGGQLTSTQGLPGKAEEDFVRIAVKVRMSGSIEALRAVLHSLDTNMPLLLVDQLDISPVRGARNRSTNKMDPSSQLNVSFEVISFMRAKAS